MQTIKLVAVATLGMLTGCYPPTQTQYSPAVVEQPQPVHFFYGTLIAQPRLVSLEYGRRGGFGAALFGTSPYLAGLEVAGTDNGIGLGAAFGGTALIAAGTVPELSAKEYTVMPQWGTSPPDPYVHTNAAAVIVVQNDVPGEPNMQIGQRVVVRVVGKSGRVMADPLLPWAAAQLAAGPLPIPLPCPPSVTDCSPYGYGTAAASFRPPPAVTPPPCSTTCNPTSTTVDIF